MSSSSSAANSALDATAKIIGPTLGAIFICFILAAFFYLWHHARGSEAEIAAEKAKDLESGPDEEGTPGVKTIPFGTVQNGYLPPPYTRFAEPRRPEPAVVRVSGP
ncbi:hypothetical protein TWF694_003210 [Orbilia ellipsospora]|uniref:Uncharacterized protein n=1 Tax=Orbilia ellipsospora TaxID=2528407 RepID=A0AAV9X3F1_9PEZI